MTTVPVALYHRPGRHVSDTILQHSAGLSLNLPECGSTPYIQPAVSTGSFVSRRHSYNPSVRRPIRSSPLAGPALSGDDSTESERTGDIHTPSSIVSAPALDSLSPPPSARRSRPRSAHGLASAAIKSQTMIPDVSPTTLMSTPSVHSLVASERIRSKRRTVHLSPEISFAACPSIPESPYQPQRRSLYLNKVEGHSELPSSSSSLLTSSQGATSKDSLPSPSHSPASPGSWLTDSPYEKTPRFSRLSLSSPGVVLPVSVREHRRISKAASSGSIRSAIVFEGTSGKSSRSPSIRSQSSNSAHTLLSIQSTPNIPSLSLTRTSSINSSSSDSLPTPSLAPRTLTPSIVSSSDVTAVNDEEEPPVSRFSLSGIRQRSLSRIKSFSLKGYRSENDLRTLSSALKPSDVPSSEKMDERKLDEVAVLCNSLNIVGGDGSSNETLPSPKTVAKVRKGVIRRLVKTLFGGVRMTPITQQ